MPVELTGRGFVPAGDVGANAIVALPDGDLLVGEVWFTGGPGTTLDVHRVRLSSSPGGGWTGSIVTHPIGTFSGANASIKDLELHPSGDVLVGIGGGLASPMTGVKLAWLNLGTGTPTPIPVPGITGVVQALAMSADGQVAYVGDSNGSIWRKPLPSGAANVLATVPAGVLAMDRDNQGNLVVGTIGGGVTPCFGNAPNLFRVDTATGTVTSILANNVLGVRNAVLVERNTGTIFTGHGVNVGYVQGNGLVVLTQPGAGYCSITGPAWGVPAGFAMVPAVDSFGSQSTCVSTGDYEWQTAPNPGGIPLVGDPSFSITMEAPSPQPVCLFALSFGRAATPVPLPNCAQLLLAPTSLSSLIVSSTLPAMTAFTLPLPIPNSAGLGGLRVFAQTVHLVGAMPVVLESSPGLRLEIL